MLEAAARASVVDGLPTFALPVLAGSAGEAIDSGALSSLLQQQLAARDEEEEKEESQPSGCSSWTPGAESTFGTDVLASPTGPLLRVPGSPAWIAEEEEEEEEEVH